MKHYVLKKILFKIHFQNTNVRKTSEEKMKFLASGSNDMQCQAYSG